MAASTHSSPRLPASLLLAAAVLAALWPVLGNGFLAYDDDRYVTDNPKVQAGLTAPGVAWAFGSLHAANWHPVTWISHMLDTELYGDRPAGHHLTSLLLHAANTVLLFLLLDRMTGLAWRSAIVAALFGLHPLHVESVAWIAERKDMLSTFFWLLAIAAYLGHVRRPRASRYGLVVLLVALALASKPMPVTAPFTLLLLDYWPLGRLGPADARAAPRRRFLWLVVEKLPLLGLSVASSVVTLLAQRAGGALAAVDALPLSSRVANAAVAYAAYLGKTLWPARLAVHYPHALGDLPGWKVAAAVALLGALTLLVFRERRRRPYLPFGWLWYVGTLVPVIGLVQVGSQAMADRYTYVPLIGIFVIVAWGSADLLEWVPRRASRQRRAAAGTASDGRAPAGSDRGAERAPGLLAGLAIVLTLVLLATGSWVQARRWSDTVTLFEYALAAAGPSAKAHNVFGQALGAQGRPQEAIEHYRRALALNPRFAMARNNLGGALSVLGRTDEAIREYEEAIRIVPAYPEAHNNLGTALAASGRTREAIEHFTLALAARPDYGKAHANLAAALYSTGDYTGAWKEVALARRAGFEPPAALVKRLCEKAGGAEPP